MKVSLDTLKSYLIYFAKLFKKFKNTIDVFVLDRILDNHLPFALIAMIRNLDPSKFVFFRYPHSPDFNQDLLYLVCLDIYTSSMLISIVSLIIILANSILKACFSILWLSMFRWTSLLDPNLYDRPSLFFI